MRTLARWRLLIIAAVLSGRPRALSRTGPSFPPMRRWRGPARSRSISDTPAFGGMTSTREDGAVSVKWIAREGALQEHGSALSLAVELSALLPTIRGEDRPGGEVVGIMSGAAFGWTYHLNGGGLVELHRPCTGLSLDVGVRHAISRAADEWGGTAGFTVAFPW